MFLWVKIINNKSDFSEVKPGEILVISNNIKYNLDTTTHISGIIDESNSASEIINKEGIPCISMVKDACTKFKNGEIVTLNLKEGIILKGLPRNDIKVT